MGNDLFETFDNGSLRLPESTAEFADIPWTKHPAFDGVELKHIVSAKDTAGQFSYHLVRIAPGKSIGNHIHETQLETHGISRTVYRLYRVRCVRKNTETRPCAVYLPPAITDNADCAVRNEAECDVAGVGVRRVELHGVLIIDALYAFVFSVVDHVVFHKINLCGKTWATSPLSAGNTSSCQSLCPA